MNLFVINIAELVYMYAPTPLALHGRQRTQWLQDNIAWCYTCIAAYHKINWSIFTCTSPVNYRIYWQKYMSVQICIYQCMKLGEITQVYWTILIMVKLRPEGRIKVRNMTWLSCCHKYVSFLSLIKILLNNFFSTELIAK